MRDTYVTPIALATHEFRKALRVTGDLVPPFDALKMLVAERGKCVKLAISMMFVCIVASYWLKMGNGNISLKIPVFADIPISYYFVLFVSAAALAFSTIQIINYFFLEAFTQALVRQRIGKANPSALVTLLDGNSAWTIAVAPKFGFLQSGSVHKSFSTAFVLLLAIPFVLVYLYCYWINVVLLFQYLTDPALGWMRKALSIPLLLIVVLSLLLLVSIFVPFRFEKNTQFIRWMFLHRLYARAGLLHPRGAAWLS
ncbi:hypothetical protein ACKTEK_02910 [Tepidamorphus sp. 3E244]|uniref:hypothetical protein n=1 Tax=Tepidamorphus sp. 3E244 TaxID=3385498 RepID=UPI0038FBF2AB